MHTFFGAHHRSPCRWLAAAAVAFAVALPAPRAAAYCRTTTCNPKADQCRIVDGCTRSGPPVSWGVMPIPFRFHGKAPERLDRDEARGAVRLAFQRWTEVVCPNGRRTSLRFREDPEIPASIPRGKLPFGIYFRDDGWPHDDVEQTLALTTQLFFERSGEIRYSDIEINSGQHELAVRDTDRGKDLEAILTHEVGHYIGLAHSPERDSIMVPSYCQSEARCAGTNRDVARDLGEDDVVAVCALYPPAKPAESDEAGGCTIAGVRGRGDERSGDLPFAVLTAAAISFVVVGARRRR